MSALLIAFDVDHQVHAVVEPLAYDESDEELQGLEGLAFSSDKQPSVVALDLENGAVKVIVVHLLQCEHDFGVHQREERLDDFGGHGDNLGRRIQ